MTIGTCPLFRSLLAVKRTWLVAAHMSALDPKRTSCCGGNPRICLGLGIVVNRRRRATCSDTVEADSRRRGDARLSPRLAKRSSLHRLTTRQNNLIN
jgi:hypothetical protein